MRLYLGRCRARLSLGQRDYAAEDVDLLCALSPYNREISICIALVQYHQRKFRASYDRLEHEIATAPESADRNGELGSMLSKCKERMAEMEGQYNFREMLYAVNRDLANPAIDCADFVSDSIEIRECEDKGHAGGYFASTSLKAGQLLLVEKALCFVYIDPEKTKLDSCCEAAKEEEIEILLDKKLTVALLVQVHRDLERDATDDTSIVPHLRRLSSGSDVCGPRDPNTKLPTVDK